MTREFLPPVREHAALDVPLERLLTDDGRLDLYPEVTGKNYLTAHLAGNTIRLSAGNHVGLIPLNDRLAITVNPRVDIQKLSRLLAVSGYVPVALERFTRSYTEDEERFESIVDHLAKAFITAVDELLHRGLIHEYHSRSEATSFPRGRILVGQTIQRSGRGQRHLVTASWFEPTTDVPANRLLKFTLFLMAAQYAHQQKRRGHSAIVTQLNRLFRGFDRVTLVRRADELLQTSFPREFPSPWTHYTPAVALALLFLRSGGIDLGIAGRIGLPSLLVNMADVFEDYLREVLSSGLMNRAPDAVVLDGNTKPPEGARQPLFSNRASPEATPDIVVRDGNATVVLEVKYKTTWTRDDLNQTIAYGLSYGASAAVILHLGGSAPAEVGTIAALNLHSYSFDLSADLRGEDVRLCNFVSGLLRTHSLATI